MSLTGKAFEERLGTIFDGYRSAGIADIEKIDPPVKVMGGGRVARRVIFLANPWLDFGGTWNVLGGRAIMIEAKSTMEPRLALGTGGVTHDQIKSIRRWHGAGAAVAVAWNHQGEIRIVTAVEILDAWDAGAKSIRWKHLPAIQHHPERWIEYDILREIYERS